ncbi:MAG: AzlC family ABC transporter permease [Spirochaetia bacterium]
MGTQKVPVSKELISGLQYSLPIMAGYFPVAVAFGILGNNVGITALEGTVMSLAVFAGAAQFAALHLFVAATAGWQIIIAVFFLNLRHFLMSASLSHKIAFSSKLQRLITAFGVTDETFAVQSAVDRTLSFPFMAALEAGAYTAWVAGTIAGYLIGGFFSSALQSALSVGLYGLFAALSLPYLKTGGRFIVLFITSGVLNWITSDLLALPSGWGFVIAMIGASALGTSISEKKETR